MGLVGLDEVLTVSTAVLALFVLLGRVMRGVGMTVLVMQSRVVLVDGSEWGTRCGLT